VRNVEVLANDKVVANHVTFPYNLSAYAVGYDPLNPTLSIKIRVTDTGGNSTFSNTFVYTAIADTIAPTVSSITVPPVHSGPKSVSINFSESVQFTGSPFSIIGAGPDHQFGTNDDIVVAVTGAQLRNRSRVVQLTNSALAPGQYRIVVAPSAVTDIAGNPLSTGMFTGSLTVLQAPPTIGYYTDSNSDSTGPNAPILLAGFTPIHIDDISSFDLSTIDILMIDESSNGSLNSPLQNREPDIAAWVASGGKIVIHDRAVQNLILIAGGSTITLTRSLGSDLNIANSPNLVTAGPFGNVTNTNLDGGNSSDHGWALQSSLPAGSTTFLIAGTDPTHAAAFSYHFCTGFVYYSTIPLDYYLDLQGSTNLNDALGKIYLPNVLMFVNGA